MVNSSASVVWYYRDNRWTPLQLSSITLHGVVNEAHRTAISEFLCRVANKELILQDNGFSELTEEQKELMLQDMSDKSMGADNENVIKTTDILVDKRKISLGQIPEDNIVEQPKRPSMPELRSIDRDNLYIFDLLERRKKTDSILKEHDEIVLRLLKKYWKYSKDALDEKIVKAIEKVPDEQFLPRSRKMGTTEFEHPVSKLLENNVEECTLRMEKISCSSEVEKIYENLCGFQVDTLEKTKNENVTRWLEEQNIPARRHSAVELPVSFRRDSDQSLIAKRKYSFGFESCKSSRTVPCAPESRKSSWCDSALARRKNSVGSNSSFSDCDEENCQNQWQKFLKKHLSVKNPERRLRKQWQAWSRNRRKFSFSTDTIFTDLTSQP